MVEVNSRKIINKFKLTLIKNAAKDSFQLDGASTSINWEQPNCSEISHRYLETLSVFIDCYEGTLVNEITHIC